MAVECSTIEFLNVLKGFCEEEGIEWKFTAPESPHRYGCAEVLIKTCRGTLKRAIGEQVLPPLKLYTCLLKSLIWLINALSEEFQMTQMTELTSVPMTSC